MLGKLMKYDLRSCMRRFGGLWIAVAVLAVINGFSLRGAFSRIAHGGFANFLFNVLPTVLLVGVYAAMAVLALVFICERFYKGLLGEEGYLMFTLPVSVSTHIASKTLTAVILEILSALVAFLSGAVLLLIYGAAELGPAWESLKQVLSQYGIPSSLPWLMLECLVLLLAVAFSETLKIYTAISIGHLAKKSRGFLAIVAYIGINVVLNLLAGVLFDRLAAGKVLDNLFGKFVLEFSENQWIVEGVGGFAGAIALTILAYLVLSAVFFFVTRYILKNRLNLE